MPTATTKFYNIAFSTTRQWNPGDEFILFGVTNLLRGILGPFNSLIVNRNPQVRSASPTHENTQATFWDNSIKPDQDYKNIDLAVFAGTPAWLSHSLSDFYLRIYSQAIPSLFLGLGAFAIPQDPIRSSVIKNSLLVTVRDKEFVSRGMGQAYNAIALPCPALFAAKPGTEKKIDTVKTIGLGFALPLSRSVPAQGINENAFAHMLNLYTAIIKRLSPQFSIVFIAHYIDEIAQINEFFPNIPVRYSYDAKDYLDIYNEIDFIVSPRVHGIGLSASLGIPGMHVSHDFRGNTCEAFCSTAIDFSAPLDQTLISIVETTKNIQSAQENIISHKNKNWHTYTDLLTSALKGTLLK